MSDAGPQLTSAHTRFCSGFFASISDLLRHRTLGHVLTECEQTGRLRNFDRAAGRRSDAYEGYCFNDSDVYKTIEGVAYLHQVDPVSEAVAVVGAWIERIRAAQQPDGYLNSYFGYQPDEPRFTNFKDKHELYCAGHLIEAGIAWHVATGDERLLSAGRRFADLLVRTFGPAGRFDLPGHPEIELALLRLARHVGEPAYADLARFFVGYRGVHFGRENFGEYAQDHLPLRAQREAVGHAVRAMYLYAAATEIAAADGDEALGAALDTLWDDVTLRKRYITGGIGSSPRNEGFTAPYDLPPAGYAETCAAIGLCYWADRMFRWRRGSKYYDIFECALYNNILAALGRDGTSFFYANPLTSDGQTQRSAWFDCACCPPNLLRFLPTIGSYIHHVDGAALYTNLFVASASTFTVGGARVSIAVATDYPVDGAVRLRLEAPAPVAFAWHVRVPAWAAEPVFSLNGRACSPSRCERGYAVFDRMWAAGDALDCMLPMPIVRVTPDPHVIACRGRAALRRGPVIFCFEQCDNELAVDAVTLDQSAEWAALPDWDERLGPIAPLRGTSASGEVATAIPYFAWANRGAHPMRVWVRAAT